MKIEPCVHASLTLLVCEKWCCLWRARYKNLNILELNRTKIWLVTASASMPQPQSTMDANVATRRSTAIITPITLWWAQPGITAATETVTTSTPTFTAEGTKNRKNTSRHKPTQHLPEKNHLQQRLTLEADRAPSHWLTLWSGTEGSHVKHGQTS